MTLMELTSHEAGIIVYGGNTVGVFNWGRCDDNQIPVLSPLGEPMPWPEADDVFDEAEETHVEDIRTVIPGRIWTEDGKAETDLDVVYDQENDLARLFLADLDPVEYEGYVYTLKDGRKVIAPDMWI